MNIYIDVDSEIEPDENTLLPLNRDEYLPWQASVLEPQNPLSLATSISTNTINIPALSAYAPKGIPKKIEEESKGSLRYKFIVNRSNTPFIFLRKNDWVSFIHCLNLKLSSL